MKAVSNRTKSYTFHYRGIHISIHWTFLLVIIWLIIANIITGFQVNGWIWSLIMVISLLASIFLHDLAQAIVAALCRIQIDGLIIMPTGSIPGLAQKPKKKIYEFLMLGAGPAANLGIAGVLTLFLHPYMAYWNEPENIGVAYAGNFIFQLQFINLSLGLLNLLPVFPMDGGRALDTLLEKRFSTAKAKRVMNIISIVIAIGFVLAGIIVMKFALLMIGLFILVTERKGEYYHSLRMSGPTT
jgi:Zn-dependent protease